MPQQNQQLSRAELDRISKLVEAMGDLSAAKLLCVHPQTVNKALAQRRLRSSTAQCLKSRLRELSESPPAT